jgi:hypothetical protein
MRRILFALFFASFSALAVLPARAGDDPFAVKDVPVDASAASASEAFTIAVNAGRQKAWTTLVHRLTRQEDWPKLAVIDDQTLQRMIRCYNVAGEKRSTTRYVAKVTYVFNPALVRRFLTSNRVAYTDMAAPPLLLIPMAPHYVPDSLWAHAWAQNRMAAGAVPIDLPANDQMSKSILGGIAFDTAAWSDVQPAASRARTGQVALALVSPYANGKLTASVKILSAFPPQIINPVTVTIPPGTQPSQAYQMVMQAAANAIGDAWKMRNAIDFNQRSSLVANLVVDSLARWGAIQQTLAKVPVVTNVNVVAMNMGEAQVQIGYAGTTAQLSDFLTRAGLGLSSRDGVWWLQQQGAGGAETERQ